MIESGAVVYVPAISDCMPVYSVYRMQGTNQKQEHASSNKV